MKVIFLKRWRPVFLSAPILFILLGSTLQGQSVRFGVCTSPSNAAILLQSGYSYLEGSVGRDLMPGQPDSVFLRYKRVLDTCRIPVVACNGFLPGSLRITGPEARHDTVLRYMETAFRRAGMLGIRCLVLGSAGARNIPEGFDPAKARQQFIGLLKEAGPIARKYGVTIAIENLQRSESNFINTVEEALGIAREVNDPNVRLLADIFHMMREKEDPAILGEAKEYIVHCHIAEIRNRTAPGMTGDDFRPYFRELARWGYSGCISIEGSWKPENLAEAYRILELQWNTIR